MFRQPDRASGIEARARLELAAREQIVEQVPADALAGRGELFLRFHVDLGRVRGRDLEIPGQVRRQRKRGLA